jgi:hypothetical protein
MLYPNDWLTDEVSMCSMGAQGLWLRMMFIMHTSTRYGYLVLPNGSPIPSEMVARRCGTTLKEYESLLSELDGMGKLKRTPDGVIYSKRMVEDEKERAGQRLRMNRFREKGGGDPHRWTSIRRPILDRDREICAYCGKHAVTVDHIIPKSKNGTEDPWNLVACCKGCNNKKTNRTPEQAGMNFWSGFDLKPILDNPEVQRVLPNIKNDTSKTSLCAGIAFTYSSSELHEDSLRSSSSSEPKQVRSESDSKRRPVRSAGSETLSPDDLAGTLPLNDGTDYQVSKVEIAEWKNLYPAVDVMQECREMKGWLSAHPARRKTRRGILKFVHSWLSREQDKGRSLPDAPAQRSSGANQRVSANQEAIRRAVERRGIFDFGATDNADHEGVSAPGTRGVAGDFSTGLRDSDGSPRPAAREGGAAGTARHAGPEILSPSIGTR